MNTRRWHHILQWSNLWFLHLPCSWNIHKEPVKNESGTNGPVQSTTTCGTSWGPGSTTKWIMCDEFSREKPCHWSLWLQPGRDLSKIHNPLIQQTVKPTSPRDHSIIHLPEEKLPISDEVGHMNLDIRGIPHVLHHSVSINYNKEHVTSLCKTQVIQFIRPCSNRHMQRRGDFYNHHIGGDWAMNQMKWVILELDVHGAWWDLSKLCEQWLNSSRTRVGACSTPQRTKSLIQNSGHLHHLTKPHNERDLCTLRDLAQRPISPPNTW